MTQSKDNDLPILTYGSEVSTASRILKFVVAVVVVLAVAGTAWALWYKRGASGRGNGEAKKQFVPPTLEERTRDAMLACLAQPGFVGSKARRTSARHVPAGVAASA